MFTIQKWKKLTQHSKLNRKNHQFIICECERSDALRNHDRHKYKMIWDDEQLKHYEKSKLRFETKHENSHTKYNI